MAASGFTPISLYYSTTAAAVPVNTNLANGELAINITDGKLYYKDNGGTVRLLASNATSAPVLSFQTSLSGLTPSTATTGVVTLAGTLGTSSGGTNLTSFTSGGVVYASSSSALATGSILQFTGAGLTLGSNSLIVKNAVGDSNGLRIFQAASDVSSIFNFYNGSLAFGVNNTESMRLTSTGLGIGTSSPSAKLDVTGTVAISSSVTLSGGTANGVTYLNGSKVLTSGSELQFDSVNLSTNTGGSNATMGINSTSSSLYLQSRPDVSYSRLVSSVYLLDLLTSANQPITFSANNAERFRIGGSGQLGIGGANYGLAGQVLTSGGASAAPTWASAGGGSGFTAKTANYTAASGDNILANTSSGSWTLTLPASPSTGNAVQVMDSIGTFGQYPLTVARNGSTIMSAAEDMTMAVNGAATTFVYNGSTWRVI
jgi:hypothetical protein